MAMVQILLQAPHTDDLIMRITAELHKRGFEIRSFQYEREEDEIARVRIIAMGDEMRRGQILRQLNRLSDIEAAAMKAC